MDLYEFLNDQFVKLQIGWMTGPATNAQSSLWSSTFSVSVLVVSVKMRSSRLGGWLARP